ncbi:hypothetical protein [Vitiosangium sp. GDMCC 1.1324]|uniref:hypothetical protein n=1 Tax=Vitiosangium sp. (strain GDMCC 1.1324) TaxID=2138576 RepID=UPI000D379116|nr:hypothetical protein [Vitiosangium sp. GDMCC 1.1324]PTL76943.1 hypothetical protein DAT35_47635 [Vitiosangium sp. GDMCC 1.1324]
MLGAIENVTEEPRTGGLGRRLLQGALYGALCGFTAAVALDLGLGRGLDTFGGVPLLLFSCAAVPGAALMGVLIVLFSRRGGEPAPTSLMFVAAVVISLLGGVVGGGLFLAALDLFVGKPHEAVSSLPQAAGAGALWGFLFALFALPVSVPLSFLLIFKLQRLK